MPDFLAEPAIAATVLAIYLVAGLVKGALGFGLPLVAVTLLPFVLPVETALALNAVVIVVTNAHQVMQAGQIRPGLRVALPLCLGAVLTIPLGAIFVAGISARDLMAVLGTLVLMFVLLSFARPTLRTPERWWRPVGFGVGLISGIVGALTSSPGSVFVTYVVSLHLERQIYMATLGLIMSLFGAMLAASYASVGLLQWQHIGLGAVATVPGILGMIAGNAWARRLPLRRFRQVVLAILGLLAVVMIRRALL